MQMTIPDVERRIRAGLPIIRFMQKYIPHPVSNWFIKQSAAHIKLGSNIIRETISADGVSCEWVIPQNSRPDQVLLYLHGGGFVFSLTPQHLKMSAFLAKKIGIRVLLVDYRTAPEHPFPAALEDCETVYHWLIKQGVLPQNIVVAGDSAGGNLTLTLLMKLRDNGIALPSAAACLSPAGDFTPKTNDSSELKDPLLPPKAMKFYTESYVGENDPRNPMISPIFGDFDHLPPLLIHVGEDEILCEEAIRIANLAKSAGVDVRLEIYPRMWHVWQIFLSLPQAVSSLDDIAQFFRDHLAT
jgi:acetyl esterase/lipase